MFLVKLTFLNCSDIKNIIDDYYFDYLNNCIINENYTNKKCKVLSNKLDYYIDYAEKFCDYKDNETC